MSGGLGAIVRGKRYESTNLENDELGKKAKACCEITSARRFRAPAEDQLVPARSPH